MVLGLCLFEIEGELQGVDIAFELGHGIDAALVQDERVSAAVSVGGTVVNHGLVLVGHADVLVSQSPAGRLDACLGGGGCGVVVKIVCVGQV